MSNAPRKPLSATVEMNIDHVNSGPSLSSPDAPRFTLLGLNFTLFIHNGYVHIALDKASAARLAPGWSLTLDQTYPEVFDDIEGVWKRFVSSKTTFSAATLTDRCGLFICHVKKTPPFISTWKVVSANDFYPHFHYFVEETAALEFHSDCVLSLVDDEDKKVYVNKVILSTYSSVFRELFFGNLVEHNHKEIPLTSLKFEDFIEYVMAVYPNPRPLKLERVPILLKLADRFDNDALLQTCETFLIETKNKAKALAICDSFGLDDCFQKIVEGLSTKDLKTISLDKAKTFKPDNMLAILGQALAK